MHLFRKRSADGSNDTDAIEVVLALLGHIRADKQRLLDAQLPVVLRAQQVRRPGAY
jgi:hypothetical protein